MSFIVQGEWSFLTASITGSNSTTITLGLNAQSTNINFAKFISNTNFYMNFKEDATTLNSLYVPANTIVDFDPMLKNTIYAISGNTPGSGSLFVAYFQNKQSFYN